MWKNLLALLALLLVLTPKAASAAAGADPELALEIDGHVLSSKFELRLYGADQLAMRPPAVAFVRQGRAYIPLRLVAEELGAQVDYQKGRISIALPEDRGELKLNIGSREAELAGRGLLLDAPPYLRDDVAYVPLRLVAEAFGAQVDYLAAEGRVRICTGEPRTAQGVQLKFMTAHFHAGMGATLRVYYGYAKVADLYGLLWEGRLRQAPEPQTEYGELFILDDYYCADCHVGFYDQPPLYDPNSVNDAENAALRFVIYRMYEGEPEFGPDSRYLLYDEQEGLWYVLDEAAYESFHRQVDLQGEALMDIHA